jgi:hypothetical protein
MLTAAGSSAVSSQSAVSMTALASSRLHIWATAASAAARSAASNVTRSSFRLNRRRP